MRVRVAALLAWCGPCLPLAALGLPLVVYLPPHYSGTLGLPLGVVGTLFALVRLVDIPLDPLIGSFMDQTRSRFGQFRPWLVGGAFLLMAGVWMLFMERPGVTAAKAFASLLILYLGYSTLYLAQASWGSRLSGEYAERARVFGWWTAFNVVGTILVLVIPPTVLNTGLVEGPGAGVQAMGWFILALLPITALAAALIVPEGEAPPEPHGVSLKALRATLADPRMRLLLALDLAVSVVPAITGALFLFFFTQVKGFTQAQTSILLLFYFVAGLAAAPLWIRLATRLSKHRAVAIAALWLGIIQLMIPLLPNGNMALTAFAMVLAGIPFAAPAFLLRAMLADLNDAQLLDRRLKGQAEQDTTGLAFALLTATAKLGYAIPVGLLYPLLGLFGFDPRPSAVNEGIAITGLLGLFIVPPVLCGLLAFVLARRWPIDATAHADIRARLAAASA